MRYLLQFLALLLLSLTIYLVLPSQASAHERRNVDKYLLVVGFSGEPAIEGMPNGASLRVTNSQTDKAVEGLEKTVKVEIIYGDKRKTLPLRPVFRQPGSYVAELIPTRPGAYIFRFFGEIEGISLEQSFESGPGRFNNVESAASLQFPEPVLSAGEVQKSVSAAQQTAGSSRSLGLGGLIMGTAGLLVGGISLAYTLGKSRKAK